MTHFHPKLGWNKKNMTRRSRKAFIPITICRKFPDTTLKIRVAVAILQIFVIMGNYYTKCLYSYRKFRLNPLENVHMRNRREVITPKSSSTPKQSAFCCDFIFRLWINILFPFHRTIWTKITYPITADPSTHI
jgi:hypothetical protein